MVAQEIDMLRELIENLETAIRVYDSTNVAGELYDLLAQADSLYSDEVPKIAKEMEFLDRYSGTLERQAKVILALLKRKLIRETVDFEAGIMPITFEKLSICPKAQEVYRDGIKKYHEVKYERNVLYDMRVSLELLIKQVTQVNKSLENQREPLGQRLKPYHKELRNLVWTVIDYLSKYQNAYVKHNSAVNPAEMNYIIEQTSAVINFLVAVEVDTPSLIGSDSTN